MENQYDKNHRITITPNENKYDDYNALDILAIFLKGQKIIYIESKTYCQDILNKLMIPAILLSVLISVFSMVFNNYTYGPIIIACIAGCNSFLLSMISYLKLDAKSESHRISSYKFDKLQTLCEFNSGKLLLFGNDKVIEMIDYIEKEIKEIKDINKFIIPEYIRYNFKKIYSTNIFSLIKMLNNEEKNLFNKLIIVNNKLNKEFNEDLLLEKEEIIKTINLFRNKYLDIDKDFNFEIEKNIPKITCFSWLKT
jgi:hypothetical protein